MAGEHIMRDQSQSLITAEEFLHRPKLSGMRSELIDGIIHYVQAFCHRAIGDIVFRNRLPIPILTIEGNTDFALTQHLKTRLEAFIDMLGQIKQRKSSRGGMSCPIK